MFCIYVSAMIRKKLGFNESNAKKWDNDMSHCKFYVPIEVRNRAWTT